MTCIKILASQMGVVSCGDGGRDSSVHILSCGACAFRVGRRMRMRCEDVGFPDQRGVVVTPSEQAQPRASESREQIPAPARRPPACGSQDAGVCTLHHPALRPPTKHRAFIVEVCTWMPRVIPFSTYSSVVSPARRDVTGHIASWLRAQPEHTQHGHVDG